MCFVFFQFIYDRVLMIFKIFALFFTLSNINVMCNVIKTFVDIVKFEKVTVKQVSKLVNNHNFIIQ